MRKNIFTIIVMIMVLLFPTVVNAEDSSWLSRKKDELINESSISTSEKLVEVKEKISDYTTKAKEYIAERREARNSEAETPNQETTNEEEGENDYVSVVTDNDNLEINASVEYEKEYEHVGVQSSANLEVNISDTKQPLKDSEGSVSANIKNTVNIHDEKLLKDYNIVLESDNTKGLSYTINDKEISFNTISSNILSSEKKYTRKNLFGRITKEKEKTTSLENNHSYSAGINKTQENNKNILNIFKNKNISTVYETNSKKTKHGLFKDYTVERNLKISGEVNYSKNLTIEIPIKEETTPTNEEEQEEKEEVTTISLDKVSYNSSNPLTMDKVTKDILFLVVSLIGLFGLTYTKKKLSYNY